MATFIPMNRADVDGYKIKTHFNVCSNRVFSVDVCPLLFVVVVVGIGWCCHWFMFAHRFGFG